MNYISNSNNDPFMESTNDDVLKHVESLRTRLGFARFKLNNGWENNTLVDVECFWKQKQKQSMRNIPIPRFTQQDIIDKRSYIQASGAKHAKTRRYRLLNRSLSASSTQDKKRDFHSNTAQSFSAPSSFINTTNTKSITKKARRKSNPISSSQRYDHSSSSSSSNSSICSNDDEEHIATTPQQPQQKYHFHHYDKSSTQHHHHHHKSTTNISPTTTTAITNALVGNHSVSSFDASCVPNDLNGEPSEVKNSLDYLSYAIAMTENKSSQQTAASVVDADEKEEEKDWTRTSQLRLSLSIPNPITNNTQSNTPPPPSPSTNVAAQAMLMFVNRESSSSSS